MISVPLAGGHLTRAADLRFKAPWAIGLALLIQIVIISLVPGGGPLRPALHVGTYLLAGAFLVLNRKIGGLWILMLGAMINAVVIGVNGGVMPANATALRTAGIHPSLTEFANVGRSARGAPLVPGRCLRLPAPLPLHNVFSVGDVLIVLGAGAILHIASDSAWSAGSPVRPTCPRRRSSGRPAEKWGETGPVDGDLSQLT